jgi:hypothetical protein
VAPSEPICIPGASIIASDRASESTHRALGEAPVENVMLGRFPSGMSSYVTLCCVTLCDVTLC